MESAWRFIAVHATQVPWGLGCLRQPLDSPPLAEFSRSQGGNGSHFVACDDFADDFSEFALQKKGKSMPLNSHRQNSVFGFAGPVSVSEPLRVRPIEQKTKSGVAWAMSIPGGYIKGPVTRVIADMFPDEVAYVDPSVNFADFRSLNSPFVSFRPTKKPDLMHPLVAMVQNTGAR